MAAQHFPYAIDKKWLGMLTPLGVRSSHGVTVHDDGRVVARFGWARVETTLDNIDHTDISGPHRWWTAVGLRLSFADDGLTFGTNNRRGVCVGFVEKVPRVIGFKDHSALWISVEDCEGLAAALSHDA